jgi:hypothetical protein
MTIPHALTVDKAVCAMDMGVLLVTCAFAH